MCFLTLNPEFMKGAKHSLWAAAAESSSGVSDHIASSPAYLLQYQSEFYRFSCCSLTWGQTAAASLMISDDVFCWRESAITRQQEDQNGHRVCVCVCVCVTTQLLHPPLTHVVLKFVIILRVYWHVFHLTSPVFCIFSLSLSLSLSFSHCFESHTKTICSNFLFFFICLSDHDDVRMLQKPSLLLFPCLSFLWLFSEQSTTYCSLHTVWTTIWALHTTFWPNQYILLECSFENSGSFWNSLLHTTYCMCYILFILHTKGTISMPSVHTAVHRQVTKNALSTNRQQ